MHVFEISNALLLVGAGLTALSRRLGAHYPALVALAGAVLALVPGTPTLVLDPEFALTLSVAPVLLDAAFDASPRELRGALARGPRGEGRCVQVEAHARVLAVAVLLRAVAHEPQPLVERDRLRVGIEREGSTPDARRARAPSRRRTA